MKEIKTKSNNLVQLSSIECLLEAEDGYPLLIGMTIFNMKTGKLKYISIEL